MRGRFLNMLFAVSLVFGWASSPCRASDHDIRGPVTSIRSCNEFLLGYQGKIIAVRIADIDCPNPRQPFGTEAKSFMAKLVNRQTVTVKPAGRDRHRRIWGEVFLSDGRSLGVEMVKAGWAQASATALNERFYDLEEDAKREKLGQWSGKTPLPVPHDANGTPQKKKPFIEQ